jgi:hypothetical protein
MLAEQIFEGSDIWRHFIWREPNRVDNELRVKQHLDISYDIGRL